MIKWKSVYDFGNSIQERCLSSVCILSIVTTFLESSLLLIDNDTLGNGFYPRFY